MDNDIHPYEGDSFFEELNSPIGGGTKLPYMDSSINFQKYFQTVMEIHFHPEYGTPYWLDRVDDLPFDPREDIKTPADLDKFPRADENTLREKGIRYFKPQSVAIDKLTTSMSSGTKGQRKILPFLSDWFDVEGKWWGWNIQKRVSNPGDWLATGPYGMIEKSYEAGATETGSMCFFVGFDTKALKTQVQKAIELTSSATGFIKTLPDIKDAFAGLAFFDRNRRSARDIIKSQKVEVLALGHNPRPLYEEITNYGPTTPQDIQAIILGARQFPDDERQQIKNWFPNAELIPMYGTSFTGANFDHYNTSYDAFYPRAPTSFLDIVGSDDKHVQVGERGNVALHRIGPDFLWPMQVEGETARKEGPEKPFNWNGISEFTSARR